MSTGESFAGKFDGLVDLNYSFLGMDLASQPSTLLSQFPGGGWPVWGILLLPVISAAAQLVMSIITMHQQHRGRRLRQDHDVPDAPDNPVDGLYAARRTVHLLDRQHRVLLIQEVTLNKYFNKILDREETEKEKAARESATPSTRSRRNSWPSSR